MNKRLKYVGIFVAAVIISFLALYFNNDIGICKEKIEKDARIGQKIPEDWQVAKDTTEIMSAMIFYNETLSDYTVSVYVNRPGLSFGYFFRHGGSVVGVDEKIAEISIDGYNERTFISLNTQQVSKVDIDNGNLIKTIEIESTKPFVFILPVNLGTVTFYDINGNVVKV
jgi:hypothetical protein